MPLANTLGPHAKTMGWFCRPTMGNAEADTNSSIADGRFQAYRRCEQNLLESPRSGDFMTMYMSPARTAAVEWAISDAAIRRRTALPDGDAREGPRGELTEPIPAHAIHVAAIDRIGGRK
ncbi:uncharacterized protein N7482_004263 [Penicillium canariense]|uniref:Uncharacterized protein n=1 Tax=Penicillium canariense TaxID=189055 RepID=A0A9W9LP71_9EURO|nr:uncharacterized protein N7482_004263 [Penicillium canariense]KAJ5168669.1 hypothetical protein N7482_004263 [Penicillium canariense]